MSRVCSLTSLFILQPEDHRPMYISIHVNSECYTYDVLSR